ncbi:DUF6044 family protein [Hymenobacter properus]|uniref:YfhO family protein n=1 Tax=Hymenobacter properus TaxID=2791026 RepID=A0A931FKH1_9BACT|nr:DUF6044 family protein [Hymenobacter properus]MBF9143952.1 hypothetical protein [Hymenobacter properus]MBR7722767.1 hypothetical protein [Microvirga sp. SRT04]
MLRPLSLALGGLLLFLLPFLLLGSHSYLTIHDNLDTEIGSPYLLNKFRVVFDYRPTTVIPSIMNGLPRNALRSGLNPTVWLFGIFPPWAAYVVNQALVRLLGLLGMWALLRARWLPESRQRGLAAGLALAWATLRIYSIYGLTVLGQPALLLAVLRLREGRGRWWDWLLVAVFPVWTFFVFVGPFIGAALGGLALYDFWHGRRAAALRVALATGLLMAMYVVVEWPLFNSLLVAQQFVSHRTEHDLLRQMSLGLGAGLRQALSFLAIGQYHSSQFFRGAVALAVLAALAWAPGGWRVAARKLAPWLLGILGVSVFCGFVLQGVALVQHQLPLLHAFNLTRLGFLLPLACFGVLALSLRLLPPGRQTVAAGLVGLQLLIGLAMNTEWTNNLRELAGHAKKGQPNYAQYVAKPLFTSVKQYLAQRTGLPPSGYRVGCLGFAPAVAQLNDFYTLDSNQNNYPLTYKRQFRPLIAGELAKDADLRAYFDAWGNRCFFYSHELGRNFLVPATPIRTVQDWALDAAAFQRLGGRFILSAARLANPARSGLRPVGDFVNSDAYWHIYVYEVAESAK